jgi:hypothetical protein
MARDPERMMRARRLRESKKPESVRMTEEQLWHSVQYDLEKERKREEMEYIRGQHFANSRTQRWIVELSKCKDIYEALGVCEKYVDDMRYTESGLRPEVHLIFNQAYSPNGIVVDFLSLYELERALILDLVESELIHPAEGDQSIDFVKSRLCDRLRANNCGAWATAFETRNYVVIAQQRL